MSEILRDDLYPQQIKSSYAVSFPSHQYLHSKCKVSEYDYTTTDDDYGDNTYDNNLDVGVSDDDCEIHDSSDDKAIEARMHQTNKITANNNKKDIMKKDNRKIFFRTTPHMTSTNGASSVNRDETGKYLTPLASIESSKVHANTLSELPCRKMFLSSLSPILSSSSLSSSKTQLHYTKTITNDSRLEIETDLSDNNGDVDQSEIDIHESDRKMKMISNSQKKKITTATNDTAATAVFNSKRKRGDNYF